MIHLIPENRLAKLCREHWFPGLTAGRRKDSQVWQNGFSFSLRVMQTEFIKSHQNKACPLCHLLDSLFDHSEAARGFCFICHLGNLKICGSKDSNCLVNGLAGNTHML